MPSGRLSPMNRTRIRVPSVPEAPQPGGGGPPLDRRLAAPNRLEISTNVVRVLGYVRVSTDGQAESGAGLAAQRATIEAECARRGWSLKAIHRDATSGKAIDGREQLLAALAALAAGEADALMSAKLDRLVRSVADFAHLLEVSKRQGWTLVALDLAVDTSTPQGEFMANVMASVAQFERRLIGQRTKEALAVKRREGVRLGRPRAILPRTEARINRRRESGWTMARIATAEGLAVSTVQRVLERA